MSQLNETNKNEFKEGQSLLSEPASRRQFIKGLGATMAIAGLSSCGPIRKPEQVIKPYAVKPEKMVEGKPTFYASAINTGNTVEGILVETYEGRPTKIEGNPDHPISQGATSMFAQGDIYNLYDPDRIQTPSQNGVSKSTDEFKQWVKSLNLNRRSKIGILIDRLPSPTFHQALREVKGKFPNSTIAEFSSYNTDKSEEGIRSLSGQSLTPNYQFDKAKTVVSIEADFLNANIYGAHYSKAFSKRRDVENAKHLNRLYVVEDTYTITGGAADHRIKLNTQNADLFLALLTSKLIDENPSKARLFYINIYKSYSKLSKTVPINCGSCLHRRDCR